MWSWTNRRVNKGSEFEGEVKLRGRWCGKRYSVEKTAKEEPRRRNKLSEGHLKMVIFGHRTLCNSSRGSNRNLL